MAGVEYSKPGIPTRRLTLPSVLADPFDRQHAPSKPLRRVAGVEYSKPRNTRLTLNHSPIPLYRTPPAASAGTSPDILQMGVLEAASQLPPLSRETTAIPMTSEFKSRRPDFLQRSYSARTSIPYSAAGSMVAASRAYLNLGARWPGHSCELTQLLCSLYDR